MQFPTPTKLPQKELLKIPLFRNIRQINGQRAFKLLHENNQCLAFESRYSDTGQKMKKNFVYVKEGELFVYKIGSSGNGSGGVEEKNGGRCLMRSFRAEEYCGFQDYPLFWGEDYMLEVSARSVVVMVPLGIFYRLFRRVISMSYLQSKAQFMKKLPIFRGVELQKIFKLACLTQKFRIPKQKTIILEGQPITYILILYTGKLQLKSTLLNQTIICGKNEQFLLKEIKNGIDSCYFTVKCVEEADVLLIGKDELLRVVDVMEWDLEEGSSGGVKRRYGLGEKGYDRSRLNSMDVSHNKQRNQEIDNRSSKQFTEPPINPFGNVNRSQSQGKNRKASINFNNRSLFAKTYTENSQYSSSIPHNKKQKTLQSEPSPNANPNQNQPHKMSQTSYSLGEIQLLKFIKRKQKIQSRNFFKYISSRAPEIVLNPSKQFALVKPLYKSTSQYVRNMKRRLKQSISINNESVSLMTHFNDFTL